MKSPPDTNFDPAGLLAPIPGKWLDPPPKSRQELIAKIDDKNKAAGLGYRAFVRFSLSKVTLLAAGTTYYMFLAVFALVAFAYGIAALTGADEISSTVNKALQAAFGSVAAGQEIDPQTVTTAGTLATIIGLIVLFYSASAGIYAVARSLHIVYGAPKDSRNYVAQRARLAAWLLALAPLVLLSYLLTSAVVGWGQGLLTELGVNSNALTWLLTGLAVLVTLLVNFVIFYLTLGHLGGIKPRWPALLTGAILAAIAFEVLKYAGAYFITLAVDKPIYGAFATPIAILLMLYAGSIILFGGASITAGIAEGAPGDSDD